MWSSYLCFYVCNLFLQLSKDFYKVWFSGTLRSGKIWIRETSWFFGIVFLRTSTQYVIAVMMGTTVFLNTGTDWDQIPRSRPVAQKHSIWENNIIANISYFIITGGHLFALLDHDFRFLRYLQKKTHDMIQLRVALKRSSVF